MSTPKHTPQLSLISQVDCPNDQYDQISMTASDGESYVIAHVFTDKEEFKSLAPKIVRAVNCHEGLIKELSAAVVLMQAFNPAIHLTEVKDLLKRAKGQ